MNKLTSTALAGVALTLLAGCGASHTTQTTGMIVAGSPAQIKLDRDGSWAVVRLAEEETKQAAIQANVERAHVDAAAQPVIIIDTEEKMLLFSMLQSNKSLANALVQIATEDRNEYHLTSTDARADVWTERINAFGGAAVKLAGTPTVMTMATASLIKGVLNAAPNSGTTHTYTATDKANLTVSDVGNSTSIAGNSGDTTISETSGGGTASESLDDESLFDRCVSESGGSRSSTAECMASYGADAYVRPGGGGAGDFMLDGAIYHDGNLLAP